MYIYMFILVCDVETLHLFSETMIPHALLLGDSQTQLGGADVGWVSQLSAQYFRRLDVATLHHYLISVLRSNIHFVSVCMTKVQPLFVVEFLHRVADTFDDYFSNVTETTIKDNYVVVYELLDEMLDNGFPLATEANILKELIKPPNILRTVVNTVTGKSNV